MNLHSTTTSSSASGPDFMRGMTYAGFSPSVFQSAASDEAIARLSGTNTNWVAVNLWWYQKNVRTIRHFRSPAKTVTDESLVHLFRCIRDNGMRILLKPMIDSQDHIWRGRFKPRSWDAWFRHYTDFMLHYGHLAEAHQIPILCIGCEFPFNNKDDQQGWRDLIKNVRAVYSGKLVYAANFNRANSYRKLRFWDQLDYIGIDAYFAMSRKSLSDPDKMIKCWRKRLKKIGRWYRRTGQTTPVLFTEAGVCSVTGAIRKPWEWNHPTGPNWEEQAQYYEAFFSALPGNDWLKGVFWWWWDNPSTGDFIHHRGRRYDSSYTPQGKDAEQVLKRYYGQLAAIQQQDESERAVV